MGVAKGGKRESEAKRVVRRRLTFLMGSNSSSLEVSYLFSLSAFNLFFFLVCSNFLTSIIMTCVSSSIPFVRKTDKKLVKFYFIGQTF